MFIDESLRMDEHPGIVFRPGPTGRRAALATGPDVWEVISALHDIQREHLGQPGAEVMATLHEVTGLSTEQLNAALRYYADYPDEVDERIEANHAEAEREEKLWRAQQRLLEGHQQ